MIATLFDFDGTLYRGHAWQDLTSHHMRERRHRRWVAAYLVRNMAGMPLYKAGLLSQEVFYRAWAGSMSWLVHGWTVEDATALFERLTDEQVMPSLRGDVLEVLEQHIRQGHEVALVSGTFSQWLDMVAQRLGVAHAIGTTLEVRDGRYTGRAIPPVCQGSGKPLRVAAYFEKRGMEVDWQASHAYADLILDLELLRKVGHPVAVYPDAQLLAEAEANGWPVIGAVSE